MKKLLVLTVASLTLANSVQASVVDYGAKMAVKKVAANSQRLTRNKLFSVGAGAVSERRTENLDVVSRTFIGSDFDKGLKVRLIVKENPKKIGGTEYERFIYQIDAKDLNASQREEIAKIVEAYREKMEAGEALSHKAQSGEDVIQYKRADGIKDGPYEYITIESMNYSAALENDLIEMIHKIMIAADRKVAVRSRKSVSQTSK